MSHFLHLHDWLNAKEAISYLKLSDIEVSLPALIKAYTALQFEMNLDFKDPAVYVLRLEEATSYPHKLFNVESIDENSSHHVNGKLLRQLFAEPISRSVMQRGYGEDEPVWIFSWMNDESFESSQNVPVYIRWDGNWSPEYRLDFELLKWGKLMKEFPNLLLFKRAHLDSLIQSESQAKENIQKNRLKTDRKTSLGSKERNTLLILIAALCSEAKINYKQRGISSAIQKMTEELGSPVSDDTINRVLKQIDSALESRSR
ncbi:hypothetical protein GCM10011403_07870 [Pseudohongiella nitratireducens]|jgi:hypothetical protein|uniref:Uncharacterized protein n=1 Tax=Pseudohongiella nitratireducens TaxID=1768907 RepID=A0A917GP01_9GAMM|nr:hypothetical protein [Pseudohongiella nitratireducens]GGG53084.1 hypothetical protein GCM10011403_07870 [Pseudohongiella nitratireducens]